MRTRFVLVGAVAAAVVLFVWGGLWNTTVASTQLDAFTDETAAVQAVRANAPENGIYLSTRGVFTAVSLRPDLSDKAADLTPMLARQLATDLVLGALLALLVLRLSAATGRADTTLLALAGLTAGISTQMSDWNWFGFPTTWALMGIAELALGWLLAGVALGALHRRMVASRVPSAMPVGRMATAHA